MKEIREGWKCPVCNKIINPDIITCPFCEERKEVNDNYPIVTLYGCPHTDGPQITYIKSDSNKESG